MTVQTLLSQLQISPETIEFKDVMDTITAHYDYAPTRFTNGIGESQAVNEAGTNDGSCKIFAFAQLNNLNIEQTLACFGSYYRDDVLKNPEGNDHGNIRNFMVYGWPGINFDSAALTAK
jgi:HopJ type III effector protein